MTKDDQRKALRRRRTDYVRALSLDARSALHTALAEQVCRRLPSGTIIGSYRAIGSEIDPARIIERAAALGHDIAYPWFENRAADMQFRQSDEFVTGPFSFPQPLPTAVLRIPDIVLVPLIGVDRSGNRLGQGAGHYDRYLADCASIKPIFTIGLCYDMQIVDQLTADPWDIAMQAIATPEHWILVTAG